MIVHRPIWESPVTDVVYSMYQQHLAPGRGITYSKEEFGTLVRNANVWLAYEKHLSPQEVAGFAIAFDCLAWGYLDHLFVLPEHRGKGAGGKLLEAIIRRHPRWRSLETTPEEFDLHTIEWLGRQGFNEVMKNRNSKWMFKLTRGK